MPVDFKRVTLDNGLTIVGEPDSTAHTAAIGFFVKAGTRDETRSLMGVSHFLEHMMFKGTERRSADDVNREFDEIGASYNAFTSQEMTAFFAHVLPEYLPKATDVLSDILRPSIREEDFSTERGVILEEIAMYDDMPFWSLYEGALEAYYGDHPLSYRVLGTRDSITAMERDAMANYFEERYSADKTTVTVAGNLDFDKVVGEITERCGGWQRTEATRQYPPLDRGGSDLHLTDEKVNRHYMLMITPAPAVQDERRYAASMMSQLLGDHDGSLLYWALVEPGLAEEAQVGYDSRDRLGEYYVYASCPPDRAEQVAEIIETQIRTCLDQFTQDDLNRQRAKMATNVTLAGERPAGRMKRLGRIWTYLGEYQSLEEELARIEAITLDDIRDVYEAFPFQPRTFATLTRE